ncbi:helix-turn-helix domain-containing protein [Microbacterium sp. UBA3486]|uniref:helix-turn-helix domain-containing protein n=1 Tax=Microbacterium TaxID=33882 RepID=UPI0025E36FC7|nr:MULTISPECIES: helix-turn-helix domain-containing protein [Microbacterium]
MTEERVAYSPAEVASLMGVSRGFVYRELREGRIPSMQLGDRILVPCQWVQSFGKAPE